MATQKFDDEFWTPAQTAEFLNLSVSWLAKARMRGDGPDYVKFGRAVRYSKNSTVRYAKSQMYRSTSEYEVRNPATEDHELGRPPAEAEGHNAGMPEDDESGT